MCSNVRVYFDAIFVRNSDENLLFEIHEKSGQVIGQYFTSLSNKMMPEKDYARILAKVHNLI